MRFIDIKLLTKVIEADADGARICSTLHRAHKSTAVRYAGDRQGYIDRNGSAKWRPLKARFTAITGKKCWYTEAELTGGDLVIDHYRPKAAYWFLAFDEYNYRVACPYANSPHHNEEYGCAGGKGDEFPLLDPRAKAKGRNGIKLERPMLLDPCNEADCKLVVFQTDGRPVLHPDHLNDAIAKGRVEKSKILLNLDHPDFNSKREQLRRDIDRDVTSHENSAGDPAHQQDLRTKLTARISRTAPFSTAARQYLGAHKHFEWVAKLLGQNM